MKVWGMQPRRHRGVKKGSKRLVSCVLIFAMVTALCGTMASPLEPAEVWTDGLCPHHPAHDDTCGYVPPTEGAPCNHVHDDTCGFVPMDPGVPCGHEHDATCGYAEGREPSPCGHVHDGNCGGPEQCNHVHDETCGYDPGQEAAPCTHVHNADCGYVPPTEGVRCNHEHDESCGYIAPEAGQPCAYVCDRCILSWQWVDPDSMLTWSDEAGNWALGLPGVGEETPLTREDLLSLLPAAIQAETPAGEQELAIEWTDLPEDGVTAGTYTLTATLADPDCFLHETAPALKVLLDVGGGETYGPWPALALNQWVWEGYNKRGRDAVCVIYEDSITGTTNEEKMASLREQVERVLPKKIYGWVATKWGSKDDTTYWKVVKNGEITNDTPNYKGPYSGPASWGYLTIDWSNLNLTGNFENYLNKDIVLTAEPPKDRKPSGDKTYILNNDEDKEVPLDITVRIINLSDHIVTPANPLNTHVNLFDYWVREDGNDGRNGNDLLPGSEYHYNADKSENVNRTGVDSWNQGINEGHALLFGNGNIHAGFWNKGAGAGSNYGKSNAGMMGIVKNTLGEDGYPQINDGDVNGINSSISGFEGISDWELCGDHQGPLGEYNNGAPHSSLNPKNLSDTVQNQWDKKTSLDYLFKPEDGDYKRAYPDVSGLFQIDDNGYYYYDMRQNFAEYDEGNNNFILYDAPAVERTDKSYNNGGFTGGRSVGNFLPFNTGAEVFDGLQTVNGKTTLYSSEAIQTTNTAERQMNHHLGMTVEIDFRQPADGTINLGTQGPQPMQFLFSGDDDVWVFIDDVLVLDLGGIHSEIYGTIDFSTGAVNIGQSWKTNGFPLNDNGTVDVDELLAQAKPVVSTNLREQFENAGKEGDDEDWSGNTFAGETNHTLKMFFLERGNYDSSLALRFNLQAPLSQQIKKVDETGQPIPNVGFKLYPAAICQESDNGAIECLYTDSDVEGKKPFFVHQTNDKSLITLETDEKGTAKFENDGQIFNFAGQSTEYFILDETKTPAGYRKAPVPIVLHYDRKTEMISVANRWTTGAYACSVSHVEGVGTLTYGKFEQVNGDIEINVDETLKVSQEKQSKGLIVAIPMLKRQNDDRWAALYGSNIGGFHSVLPEVRDKEHWREAALSAVLQQAAGGNSMPDWYFTWEDANNRLLGSLNDLPGLASRYLMKNKNGDMRMVYGIIEPEALKALGINEESAEKRYEKLGEYVNENGAPKTLNTIMGTTVSGTASGKGFSFLNVDQFNRSFRSLVYIPNERRELRVQKVGEDGRGIEDAVFGLYEVGTDTSDTLKVSGTTDENGLLIFKPSATPGTKGEAQMIWANAGEKQYYLQEISAPSGYTVNETKIPIVIGTYAIYADAGSATDNVSVLAGVGRLTQTMRQFAEENDVDITLRDITAFMQTQNSGSFETNGWKDANLEGLKRSMDLHFGKNKVIDYGLHDVDNISGSHVGTEQGGRILPYFVTDTGFIRARVAQNYPALLPAGSDGASNRYESSNNTANKDNLQNVDLTSLFSLVNIVVVTDPTAPGSPPNPKPETGSLAIRKSLSGTDITDADRQQTFRFTVEFKDAQGNELQGKFYFWGDDKAGEIRSGETVPLRPGETIVIQGLPAGTKYTVTEHNDGQWIVIPKEGKFEGTITDGQTTEAFFINSRNPNAPDSGMLEIAKSVDNTTGLTDADRAQEFTFTVTFEGEGADGEYEYFGSKDGKIASGDTITLKGGQQVRIVGLPAGLRYTVTETPAANWNPVFPISGVIGKDQIASATFVNTKSTVTDDPGKARLDIFKSVEGDLTASDRTQEFTFTVTFEPAGGEYAYTGSRSGTIRSGGTIKLRGGEAVSIHNLPADVQYTVTEQKASNWTAEKSALEGTIPAGGIGVAAFVNNKTPEPSSPDRPSPPKEDPKDPPVVPVLPPEDPTEPSPEDPVTPPENPPETTERPTELPDPNSPDAPDVVTIWDDDVPTTYVRVWDPELEEWVWIPEDEVPLWFVEAPQTGELYGLAPWIALTTLSLGGAAVLQLLARRKEEHS